MIKLGLCCCSGGLCCALLGGLLLLGGGSAIVSQAAGAEVTQHAACAGDGCKRADCAEHTAKPATATAPCATMAGIPQEVELSDAERRVVAYLAEMIEAGHAPAISVERLAKAVALPEATVEQMDRNKLRAGVMLELSRRNFDLAALGGNCSKYSACSVDRNLMNAQGDELARYQAEVAQDGKAYTDRVAPDFDLPSTGDTRVSLSGHRGRNVAVVLLSAHCHHSLDTLPILADLKREFDERDLTILPVFVNSGDTDDLKSRAWEWGVEYPLLVSEDKAISAAFESRMVPSTFLIDRGGNLRKKLVGFKDQTTLDRELRALIGS